MNEEIFVFFLIFLQIVLVVLKLLSVLCFSWLIILIPIMILSGIFIVEIGD